MVGRFGLAFVFLAAACGITAPTSVAVAPTATLTVTLADGGDYSAPTPTEPQPFDTTGITYDGPTNTAVMPTDRPEVMTALALATQYARPTETTVATETSAPQPSATTIPTSASGWPPAFLSSYVAVANVDANVRSRPSTDGAILGQVKAGEVVVLRVRTPDGTWFSVQKEDVMIGWVKASLLTVPPVSAQNVMTAATDPLVGGIAVGAGVSPPQPTPTEDPEHPGDAAYIAELRRKFGAVGDRQLTLESVRIGYLRVNHADHVIVTFKIPFEDGTYLEEKDTTAARKAWSDALLEEIKSHWPNQSVLGVLEHSFESFTILEDHDCFSAGDTLFDNGWNYTTYYGRASWDSLSGDRVDCYESSY